MRPPDVAAAALSWWARSILLVRLNLTRHVPAMLRPPALVLALIWNFELLALGLMSSDVVLRLT